jgi:predicted NAD/FAD-binding protein
MKIAVVGTGIAGNVVAYHLSQDHHVTVFEANDYIGGHTHTHDIEWEGQRYAVDTGFIVFNDKTYPHFNQLLQELNVPVQPTSMSFSVKCERTGLEYNGTSLNTLFAQGTSLNTLFAQRRNLFRPSFYRMIKDIIRFNREAPTLLDTGSGDMSLGEYLLEGGYSREFIENYLIPMGAAIWSSDPSQLSSMPAHFFIRFFHNHGMLSVNDRPTWHVITGGSKEYVGKLTARFRHRLQVDSPVESISRHSDTVTIKARHRQPESFDHVFVATHSDQALRLLRDPLPVEQEVLGAIPYQENEAVLHTDEGVLPKRRLAWASWNYHLQGPSGGRVPVTYNMNILQGFQAPVQFCVTLNNSQAIDPNKILKRITYHHPFFSSKAVAAQKRQAEINGVRRTYYCGAYWRFGFHEDGVVSALNALEHFRRI